MGRQVMGNMLTASANAQRQPHRPNSADNRPSKITSAIDNAEKVPASGSDKPKRTKIQNKLRNNNSTTGATNNELKNLSINANSLVRRLHFNIIQHYVQSYDIICIQESKLDSADVKNIHIPGFKPFYNHRKKYTAKSGGLATFAKEDTAKYFTEIKANEAECVQWFKVSKTLMGII